MVKKNQYQRIIPFVLFALALFLLFKLIQPVITILLCSILIAYITFPLYTRIHKKISKKPVAIIVSLLLILIIMLLPFSFLTAGIGQQGYYFYNSLSDSVAKGALLGFSCHSADSKVCMILNQAEQFSVEQLSKFGIDKQLEIYLPIVEEKLKGLILRIPLLLAQIFLTFVISYFILHDHKNIFRKMSAMIPIRLKTKKRLISEFRIIAHSVIYAQLFVAFVQGVIGAIGFYLFGVPFPILSGLLIAFFALIPFIGTSIIWVPASLYLFISGYISQDYWVLGKGIGLFLYGMFVIATIDNILLAKIVKSKAHVSPIILILGVIGGASLFGIIGIFIGPILLPLLITYLETFEETFR